MTNLEVYVRIANAQQSTRELLPPYVRKLNPHIKK